MDDKERIEKIMQEKNLPNVIFCAKTNIAPASLSHILGGRTKPTLPILRNIIAAFPDLNPEWVFMGTGEMYNAKDDAAQNQTDQDGENASNDSGEQTYSGAQGPFSGSSPTPLPSRAGDDTAYSTTSGGRQNAPVFNFGDMSNGAPSQEAQEKLYKTPMPSISDIVRETLVTVQKPQRKIVEVRIFFDDGTFETFSSNN